MTMMFFKFSRMSTCDGNSSLLKLKKSVNGVVVRPLYILKTSNKSARCRLSSNVHNPKH